MNLRLVKDMLADDPEGANEMLDALAADVKTTIQELRDLAHGIYPPLLLDSGLAEALRAAAGRSPLDVAVMADGIGRYPRRGRGRGLLLLPRSAPERGEACRGRDGRGAPS